MSRITREQAVKRSSGLSGDRDRSDSPSNEHQAIDVQQWGDPLAERVSWTPLKPGGASFRTHVLVRADGGRLAFRATLGAKLFALVFILGGLAMAAHVYWTDLRPDGISFDVGVALRAFGSVLFVAAGVWCWRSVMMPIVFDASRGWFWKAKKSADPARQAKDRVPFHEIHALQLVSERLDSRRSHYWSHELNLVLADERRIHVVDHGDVEALRADASQLSAFLGKPVWDATRSD